MNKLQYVSDKRALLGRLNRAEGQIRGISKMVALEEDCAKIMTQISATQAALDKIALELLTDCARHCLAQAKQSEETDTDYLTEQLVTAIGRHAKR